MHEALHRFFGFTAFRPGQAEVVERVLAGRDVLVVMPTGAGKSLCYQLPALMRPGYALVVSPLIALMKDQVDALRARGLPAAVINSTVSPAERRAALQDALHGDVRLLYVAPERLRSAHFLEAVCSCPPTMLVVDEAHCISEWGHDFRPDYHHLGAMAETIGSPQICAFTATATPVVRKDICASLGRREMEVIAAGFQRPNLAFSVRREKRNAAKDTRLEELLSTPAPTLVYASTRKTVDRLASRLNCRGYHAGRPDSERAEAQGWFMSAPCPVLVATNAFGMGIDRPDIRRVIHYNMPGSLEAYYQEAGRAGRDDEPAQCVLLFSHQDRFVHEFLLDMNNPSEELLHQLWDALHRAGIGDEPVSLTDEELCSAVPSAGSERHIAGAVRVLERHGYVRRQYRRQSRGRLVIPGNLVSLHRQTADQATQRTRFLHRVLCRFGKDLSGGVRVALPELAAIAGLRLEQTERVIAALDGQSIAWHPPFAGRAVALTCPPGAVLDLDGAGLKEKRDFELSRLDDVIAYTRHRGCRQAFLIGYFGQRAGDWRCGTCDRCAPRDSGARLRTPTEKEARDLRTALQAVASFHRPLGRGTVAKVLGGSRDRTVMGKGLDGHPLYGALKQHTQRHVGALLEALEDAGYTEPAGDPKYPTVAVSAEGRRRLRGEIPWGEMALPPTAAERRGTARTRAAPQPCVDAPTGLLDRLHSLRRHLAAKRRVAPYRILPNSALAELASRRPSTPVEAQECKGIGPVKADTVVPRFLDAIREWESARDRAGNGSASGS